MKKGRAGFSLVEVVCAMAIVALISGVVVLTLASSRNITNMSQNSIEACREAQNIVECYIAAKRNIAGDITEDGELVHAAFIGNLGLFYGFDKDKMTNKYSVSEIAHSENITDSSLSVIGKRYVFYYNSKFELLTAPESIRAGGYDFRIEFAVFSSVTENSVMKITVTSYDVNPAKEKIVYEYGAEN